MRKASDTTGIIDYGVGNLRSVQKAFEQNGADAVVLTDPAQAADVARLVLPGVGAFADAMTQLEQRRWVEPIRAFIDSARPFLGICLGMQLLFEGSEEDATEQVPLIVGLAVLKGKVVRFVQPPAPEQRIKIPHMGWNSLDVRPDDPLFAGIADGAYVYFVHSYYVAPAQQGECTVTSATTPYPPDRPFCASVWSDRIWATQFHPEKSQHVGLKMLANFAALDAG